VLPACALTANLRVRVIRSCERAQCGDLLQSAFVLRHRIFVEQKGWGALARPDRLDLDDHDQGSATHVLLLDGSVVLGHARLIPGGYLVSRTLDQAAVLAISDGSPVLGLSRFCIDQARLPWLRRDAAFLLFTGAIDHACNCGVRWLVFDTEASLIFVLRTLGFTLHSLGEPGVMNGRKLYPMMLSVKRGIVAELPERIMRWRQASQAPGAVVLSAG